MVRKRPSYNVRSIIGQGFAGITVMLATALGLSTILPGAAMAKNDRVLYVGHSTIGNNTSCASPGYTSVQAAVNAANSNQVVYLCGGQFAEQVFVKKSITITGDASSGLTATGTTFTTSAANFPPQFTSDNLFVPQALLVISGNSTRAAVNGLTFSGPMPGNGGCAEDEYGILALGGSVNLSNDTVSNIADTNSALYGCQYGVGIQIGRYYWPNASFNADVTVDFAAQAIINRDTVNGYQKNGITIDGTGSSASVTNSTVTGEGRGAPFGTIIAQNGVQLGRGATGVIEDNNISNNSYTGTGADASSAGILVFGGGGDPLTTNVVVKQNTLINNDTGIYVSNTKSDGVTPPSKATNNVVEGNRISNDAVTNQSPFTDYHGTLFNGYQAGIDEQGNSDTLKNNTISGTGYAPQQTPPQPFVLPIDTVSYPTINVDLNNNSYDNHHI